jgi:hypothetical protein
MTFWFIGLNFAGRGWRIRQRSCKFVKLTSSKLHQPMKKALLLLTAAATLGLGACNKTTCPAYSKADSQKSEAVASTDAPAARQ